MGKSRITLEQLAQEINISRTTIYKVINNKGEVREGTRTKVLSALEAYGYKPNKAAKNLARNKEYPIGFITFHSNRSPQFSQNILRGVNAAEKRYTDYGIRLHTAVLPVNSTEEQRLSLRRMLEEGVEAVAIVPNDMGSPGEIQALEEEIAGATAAGIPVITVNRDMPRSGRELYIGCDYGQSGRLAGEVLAKMVNRGNILVTLGTDSESLYDISRRLRGFEERMALAPHLRILPYYRYSGDPGDLESYIRQSAGPLEVSGIFDLTYELDSICRGKRKNPSVKVIGFDLNRKIRTHMEDQTLDAVIFQDMYTQGYKAVSYLYNALAEDIRQTGDIITKLEVVMESNIDFYM